MDLLQSVEIPEDMNFVVVPAASIEIAEFWKMINVYVQLSLQYYACQLQILIFQQAE